VWHATKPDVENLAKALLDALTGILWVDDGQVAELVLRKKVAAGGESTGVLLKVVGLSDEAVLHDGPDRQDIRRGHEDGDGVV
jgi:hypothetical protein